MRITHRKIPDLNFRHLHTFLVLARLGNFSRAAEEIGLSQSAVSRHIRSLEDSLGLRLFERLGRRAVLTSAGRALRTRLGVLMREAETLPRLLKDLREGVQGELRIGACITAANAILPPLLGQYHQRNPKVELSLLPGSSAHALEALRRGETDLAFIASSTVPDDLRILAEISDEVLLVGSATHPLCRRRVKPTELVGCDFIHRELTSDTPKSGVF